MSATTKEIKTAYEEGYRVAERAAADEIERLRKALRSIELAYDDPDGSGEMYITAVEALKQK